MKKVILIETLNLKKYIYIQEAFEKKLNCTFIRINTSKENYHTDYEVSRIKTFFSQFIDNKNKELEDEIEKLKLQLANLGVKNNEVNDKKQIIQSQQKYQI